MASAWERRTRRRRQSCHLAVVPPRSGPSEPVTKTADLRSGVHCGTIALMRGLSNRDVLPVLILGSLVGVSYFPAVLGGFVWDDIIFTQEPTIREPSGLWDIWFSPSEIEGEGHYWPIVYTGFWLEHKLWGYEPIGYHVVNVLLHFVNCLLLWRLMLRLAVPGAWFIAAVFAVHPLHVESVAWVIERKDLLSALFFLAAALTWIRFVESSGKGRYFLSLGLFAAAMLSKSIAVTLPVALLVWHWWKRGRPTPGDLLRLVPFFAVALVITAADLAFYRGREVLSLDYSMVERALIAARALWFYAGKLLWPTELAVIYPHWRVDTADLLSWAWLAAAVALVPLLWAGRHRIGAGPLVGALFFAVTLSPVLGFVDYGYMQFSFVADRYQYLAGIGVIAVLAGAATHGAARLRGYQMMGVQVLGALALVSLGTMTWRQAGIYRDPITFFSHIVSLNPAARDAYLNLGVALTDADRPEEGLAASLVAAGQRPGLAKAHSNVGRALIRLDRLDEAREHLRRALELDPRDRTGLQNTAEVLRLQEQYEEALEAYRRVLGIDPDYALAHAGLGNALYELERYEEAVEAMAAAVSRQPDSRLEESLQALLGRASLRLGRLDAAESHLRRAMETGPQDAALLVEFSELRRTQERFEESNEYLRRARALRPQDAPTLQNVAEALRKRERYEEALASYRKALEVDPEFGLGYAGLGDTLFQMGRYDESLEAMAKAVSLDPSERVAGSMQRFMGRASQQLGRVEAASDHFRRALEIDPRDSDAIDRLAMLEFGRKRYQEAERLYRILLGIQPDSAQTNSNLAATLYYLGRNDEALQSFERALSLDPALEAARIGVDQLREVIRKREP